MLALTKYANGLYLFLAGCAVLFALVANVFLSTSDVATRIGGLLGGLGVAVVLGLPCYFSFRAARTQAARHIKQAMVSSSVLLAFCALVGIAGLFTDFMITFGALLWCLPAVFAVNAFKSLPSRSAHGPIANVQPEWAQPK